MPNERYFENDHSGHTCTADDCCSAKEKAAAWSARLVNQGAKGKTLVDLDVPAPPPPVRKLYLVTYTFHAYAYAETEAEAVRVAKDVVDTYATEGAEAEEVQPGDAIHEDWEDDCFVYHKGKENLSLDALWPRKSVSVEPTVETGRPCVSCGDNLDADPNVTHCCGWGAVTSSPPSKSTDTVTNPYERVICEHGYTGRCPECDGHHP